MTVSLGVLLRVSFGDDISGIIRGIIKGILAGTMIGIFTGIVKGTIAIIVRGINDSINRCNITGIETLIWVKLKVLL